MTQAVIPLLVKKGIAGISVGVNPDTSPPVVPQLFRWRFEDSEVLATWHAGTVDKECCIMGLILPYFNLTFFELLTIKG